MTGTVKKYDIFQGLKSLRWQKKNTAKCADGTISGSVCSIVLFNVTKFNGFSCAHKSLYTFYFCKSP